MDKVAFISDLADIVGDLAHDEGGGASTFVEATFGHADVPLDSSILRVKLRRCHLHLDAPGSRIHRGSRYSSSLQKHHIEQSTSSSDEQRGSSDLAASGDFSVRSGSWIPAFGGVLKGAGRKEATNLNKVEAVVRPEILLISPLPDNKWLIGDPTFGDLRKPDGCLFGTYFTEAAADGLNGSAPLCVIAEPAKCAAVKISLVAKTTDLVFEIVPRWTGDKIKPDSRELELGLKAHIAGIIASDALQAEAKDKRHSLTDNEILLCLLRVRGLDAPVAKESGA